jgi:hypothetical protein
MSVLLDVGEANLDFDDLFATIQERVQELRIEVRARPSRNNSKRRRSRRAGRAFWRREPKPEGRREQN